MAPAKIKTAEERERLDRIFAEVEAAERGESAPEADTRTQQQIDEDNRRAKIKRILERFKNYCRRETIHHKPQRSRP